MIAKRCLFCDRIIANRLIVCKEHLGWWKEYKDTQWAKEFRKDQDRQFHIDKMECEDLEGKTAHIVQVIRINTKNEYKRADKDKIIELYNAGKTRNQIIEELKIPRSTVINIIWKHNKKKGT